MEISPKHCKLRNLQKMKIVHENDHFSGKTDVGNTVCENGNLIKWKFEKEFSKYLGNKYSVALSNGSVALEIALKALNLKKGDEIRTF